MTEPPSTDSVASLVPEQRQADLEVSCDGCDARLELPLDDDGAMVTGARSFFLDHAECRGRAGAGAPGVTSVTTRSGPSGGTVGAPGLERTALRPHDPAAETQIKPHPSKDLTVSYSPTIQTLDGTLTLWPDAMVLMSRRAGPARLEDSPVHVRLDELACIELRSAGLFRPGVLRMRLRTMPEGARHAKRDRYSTTFSRAMQQDVVVLCEELTRLGVPVMGMSSYDR